MESLRPVRAATVLTAVGVAVLMVFVVVSPTAGAAPFAPAATPVGTWSYGAIRTVSVGPVVGADGWTYEGTATVGFSVTIYDNNTSASTFELTAIRTMGAAFTIRFCYPSCSSPVDWVNLSYRAWEHLSAVSNFTAQGVVTEGSSTVPAIALESSTVHLAANLTESSDDHLPVLGWTSDRTRYLGASVDGSATTTFTPSLGLIPNDLVPGTSWNSSSEFQSVGSGNYSAYFAAHGAVTNRTVVIGPISGTVSFSPHGTVGVEGSYANNSSIQFGGITYPAIDLTVTGPFSVREGVIFVPQSANLFGGSNPSWAGNASAATGAEQSTLDVKPSVEGHFGLAASSWRYVTNSANPADSDGAIPSVAGVTPATSSNNSVSSVTLQGEPQTADQASSDQQCLTAGTGCPVVGGPAARFPFGLVLVVGAAVVIATLLAAVVVTRRRRSPPPNYPNAVLYPPGASYPSAPAGAPTTPAAPPAPEDDPLDHLW